MNYCIIKSFALLDLVQIFEATKYDQIHLNTLI